VRLSDGHFAPNSQWDYKDTATIDKTHPTLVLLVANHNIDDVLQTEP